MPKHDRPVKPATIDRRHQNKQTNAEKQPYKGKDIRKFDKRTRLTDKGQYPK